MSEQYPGGFITKSPPTPAGPYEDSSAYGMWNLSQQAGYKAQGLWPTAGSQGPDTKFNYVTLLLHGDGTNGAQNNTFTDSSTNNFTVTRNGNTTQGSFSPYGPNWSNYFGGSDYLTGPTTNSAFDFGSGDWTIETWAFPTSFSSQMAVFISLDNASSSAYAVGLLINTNGSAQVYQYGGSYFINSTSTTGVVSLNAWSHIAAVRSGSTFAIFVNGTRVASVTGVSGTQAANKTVNIGQDPYASNLRFNGYLSNLRVVKGTAVYSPADSTITVPTTALTAISGTSLLTCQSNRFKDSSSNAFAIAVSGTPSTHRFNPFGTATAYSTATIGGSAYFDGSDYLQIADSSALNLGSSNYTMECWVYPTSFAAAFALFTYKWYATGGSGHRSISVSAGTNGIVSAYYYDAGGLITSSIAIKINVWNHIALVRNGSDVSLYINGVSAGSATFSSTYPNATWPTNIGASYTTTGASYYTTGYITDFRVVIGTAVYTTAFTPPTAPLTAVSGTVILTSMQNAAIYDNAMMNDLETVGNAQISTSVKKYGTGSLAFDGTDDYLVANSSGTNVAAFGTGDFTIECWIYKNSGSFQNIFDFRPYDDAGGTNPYPTLYINSSDYLVWFTLNADRITSSVTIGNGSWYHVAVCRSGTSTKLFINGTQSGSTYTDSNSYRCGAARPAIAGNGFAPGSFLFNGYIDDFRITKGYARYTTTFTPPTAAFPNIGPT